jgi:UDP-glucose 4-epimerase
VSRDGVLLLGGGGFIGNALATRLRLDGKPVYVVGRADGGQLAKLLPQCGTVVHLASSTTPGSSAANPSLEQINLELTLHLLSLLQAQPQIHLIYFSSGGSIYGNPQSLPVTEDSPVAPLSHHGAGKAAQEVFLQVFRTQGRAISILRPSNAYGPGQAMRQGFGLIRTALEHASAGTALKIWGDGENVRDFIYIDDLVEATIRLIKLPEDSGTYNVGSGVGHSVNQVMKLVNDVCEMPVDVIYLPVREADVMRVVLDFSKIYERHDWAPAVALTEGVRLTWQWMRSGR